MQLKMTLKSCNKPRVTIGMPVFNGEKYLEEALDAILAQTYQDYELIISDNASTDNTPSICRAYVSRDKRVRYYRNKENMGVVANFNRVFQLSSTEYFKWSACDDVIASDYLLKCIEILDAAPSVALCHSRTGRINECGKLIGNYDVKLRVDSLKPHERFGDLICMSNDAWVLQYGLIRSDMLRMTQLFGRYIGSDRNLLAEIGLIGRFYIIPKLLFSRREHSKSYTDNADFKNYYEKLQWWFKTNSSKKTVFPHCKNCLEYFNSVGRMPLRWTERQLCYLQIVKWLAKEGWFYLGYDIGVNLIRSLRLEKKFKPLDEWLHRHVINR